MIEFKVLGPVELQVAGVRADLGPPRQLAILAALLVEPERRTPIEVLIDRVWDEDPPDRVRSVVYTYIARLRRALHNATGSAERPVTVHRRAGGYYLSVTPDQVDLSVFRTLLSDARAMDERDPRRADCFANALRLWRGEAFAGVPCSWARRFGETLRQLRHETLAEWADAELYRGRRADVIAELRKALLDDPLAEDLHERLIRAYYLNGQSSAALRQFEHARSRIAAELGADPCPGLKNLHALVLSGSPLDPMPVTTTDVIDLVVPKPSEPTAHPRVEFVVEPDLLPMDLMDFGGRDAEVELLHEDLTNDRGTHVRPICITGGAGIGKTALAVHVGHRLRAEFPDGRLFADLRGTSGLPASPDVIVGRLLRALGTHPADIPADLDARAELYRSKLSGRRILLILDNAASDEQIEALLPGGMRGPVVVITSRLSVGPPGMRVHTVRELSPERGMAFLVCTIGRSRVLGEPSAARRLVQYCSGIPLALRVVATRIRSRQHWNLEQLAARMSDENRRLDELVYGTMDVRASLDLSFAKLDVTTRRWFQQLGATAASGTDLVARTASGLSCSEVEEQFDRLVDIHLLQVVGRDCRGRTRYRMPDLIRIYARERSQRDRSRFPLRQHETNTFSA